LSLSLSVLRLASRLLQFISHGLKQTMSKGKKKGKVPNHQKYFEPLDKGFGS